MSWKYSFSILLIVCSSLAQQARSSSYYPLELGNGWFYRAVGRAPGDSTIDSNVRVVGDTLWPNGYRYFVLSEADIMGSRYVRVDSNSVFYVNPYSEQDMRVFRFNGQSGDTTQISWGPFWISRLASIETVQVFSQPRRILTFELDGIMFAELKFCQDLGPMTEWRYSDPPPPWPEWGKELVGCVIAGAYFGLTLNVAQLHLPPIGFELLQNYPNPFNPSTNIRYELPSASRVSLKVYNTLGQEVATLVNETKPAGVYTVQFDAGRLASGVYFYRMQAGSFVEVKKLVVLR